MHSALLSIILFGHNFVISSLLLACPHSTVRAFSLSEDINPQSRLQSSETARCTRKNIVFQKDDQPLKIRTLSSALWARFKDFDEALDIYYDLPILVTFTSPLCGPCRVMRNEIDLVRHMMKEKVVFFNIDTDRFPSLGSRYHVKGWYTTKIN